MAETHLSAMIRVMRMRSSSIAELMEQESAGSDLVLIGLRQPRPDESAADFFGHYRDILAALPTTLLVASAPSFQGAAVLFDDADLETDDGGDPESRA